MPVRIYTHPDDHTISIVGSFDTDLATNPEKIKEIFQEYLDKIGVKNVDVRIWHKTDLESI